MSLSAVQNPIKAFFRRGNRGSAVAFCGLVLLYLVALLFSAVPGISHALCARLYPSALISGPELFETSPSVIATVCDNGDFYTTDSGWIYLNYDVLGVTAPTSLSLTFETLSEDTVSTNWYYLDSYKSQSVELQAGTNHVLLQNNTWDDQGIRLDTPAGLSFRLTSVAINDTDFLAQQLCSLFRRGLVLLTAVLVLGAVFLTGRRLSHRVCAQTGRLSARRDGLIRPGHRVRNWLVRHFLTLHNGDGFTLCWAAVFLGQVWLCLHDLGFVAWLLSPVPVFALGVQLGRGEWRKPSLSRRISTAVPALFALLALVATTWRFASLRNLFLSGTHTDGILQLWVITLLGILVYAVCLSACATDDHRERHALSLIRLVAYTFALYAILETVVQALVYRFTFPALVSFLCSGLFTPLFFFNLLLVVWLLLLLSALLGPRLGGTLACILYVVLLLGNMIKILYQDTMFKPIDFMVVPELFHILPQYIGTAGVVALCVFAALALGAIIWQIRRVARFLCPRISLALTGLLLPAVILLCAGLNTGSYGAFIYGHAAWLPEYTYWRVSGTAVYNYYNFLDFLDIFPKKPANYSQTTMDDLADTFDSASIPSDSEVKPDVILIMAESLFDVTGLDGVSFNYDLTETIRTYQEGTIVSPRYGGGTAGVEFEGITGFSNYFFVNDIIAYTTYMNSSNKRIPSLASEFASSGYLTTALHLNDGSFYNRSQAYSILGFDQFLSINDFSIPESARNKDAFVRDEFFFDAIKTQLEDNDESQFIFGVSIEGHNPYDDKYEETEVTVTSDLLSDYSIHQLEQYGQSVLNFDRALADFIDYLDTRDTPTLLYIWGDHLPMLDAYDETDYLSGNLYAKYATPFVVYSNYSTVSVNCDYMTPNQIAPQVLLDSGISHSSYFDYIYALRSTNPVIHHDYTTDSSALQDYWLIQYDLMFGSQYLVND